MGPRSKFEKDFEKVTQLFPKLKYKWDEKSKNWILYGEMDICDEVGDYWNSFEIKIYISKSYPFCIPLVQEKSKSIKREADWHIDDQGFCCVEIEHKLQILKIRGVDIVNFIKLKIYPYFANQLYRQNKGIYAAGEYGHGFEGIKQFYEEDLNIKSIDLAINIIKKVIANQFPGRNESCPCGNGKFKNCHLRSVELLKSISKKQLIEDLGNFQKLYNPAP